jgi:hypothetical protein
MLHVGMGHMGPDWVHKWLHKTLRMRDLQNTNDCRTRKKEKKKFWKYQQMTHISLWTTGLRNLRSQKPTPAAGLVLPDQLSRACHLSRQKSCWRDDLTKGVITAPNPCWVTLLQKAEPRAHWDLLLNSSISSWLWITYEHLKKTTKKQQKPDTFAITSTVENTHTSIWQPKKIESEILLR